MCSIVCKYILYLKTLELDNLLNPIDNEDLTIIVDIANVTSVEPAVDVDSGSSGIGIVQVLLHDLVATDANLTRLVVGKRGAGLGVDDLELGIPHHGAARA